MDNGEHGHDSAEPGPLVRIRSLLPGLARAEQRVANIVLAEPESIARRSITDVAEAAGTSETTVTRFCKAIGVGGYPELRIALAADTARTSSVDRELGGDIGPEVADHVLTTAARETTYRSGATASRIAQLTVIDCLFVGVAQRHLSSAKAALEATYQAVAGHRLETRPDRRRHREDGR